MSWQQQCLSYNKTRSSGISQSSIVRYGMPKIGRIYLPLPLPCVDDTVLLSQAGITSIPVLPWLLFSQELDNSPPLVTTSPSLVSQSVKGTLTLLQLGANITNTSWSTMLPSVTGFNIVAILDWRKGYLLSQRACIINKKTTLLLWRN